MPRKPKSAAEPPVDRGDAIIDAALRLAGRGGWHATTLEEIAAEAGVTLLDLHDRFRSRAAILESFHRRVDRAVLAGGGAADEPRRRDRLFDVVMRRFDALLPWRDAVRSIAREAPMDPLGSLCGAASLLSSMAWMLELAGISAAGVRGALRAKLLLGIYLQTMRVFLDDDSADLARTMAALDRSLRRAERWLGAGGEAAPRAEPEPAGP